MKIISSNILFDQEDHGYHHESSLQFQAHSQYGPSWKKRKLVFKTIFQNHYPVLLCTQEGKEKQAREISELADLSLLEHHRHWISHRMYPNIFFSPKQFMVIDSGDIWLSRTPEVPGSSLENHSFPRLCVWGLFYSYQKKSLLLVANMHLDHQDASLRLKQVKIFIEEFKKIEKKCSTVGMILCGDFNEAAGGAVYQALHEAFPQLRDGWLEIAKSRGKSLHGPSFHKFSYSYYDAQRIDWIFLDQSFSIHDTFFDQTHDSGIFPSDHYPLILETTW